jgi:hypothetical protein
MKKLTLTIVYTLAVAGAALAQGTVLWNTISSVAITAQTNTTMYSPLFFDGGLAGYGSVGNIWGGNYYFELLYNTSFNGSQAAAPDAAALFGGTWLDTGLTATNSGYLEGALTPVNPNTAAVVPWARGVTNNIMLVGWSANLGTSWLAASNNLANWDTGGADYPTTWPAYFGESAMGYLTPGSSNPGHLVFGSAPSQNGLPINNSASPMQLYPLGIPEPGTVVLVGLGGISMLLFRRRK